MSGDLNNYVDYRLSRVGETLEDARLLLSNNRLNASVNRIYYACYYAVSALLVKNGFVTKTHSGVRSQFFKEFVLSGKVSKEYGRLFSDLFDWRNDGDYADFINFEKDLVEENLQKASQFIDRIKQLIE